MAEQQLVTVTSAAALAAALADLGDDVPVLSTSGDADAGPRIRLAGQLAELTMVGDALVEVGGGVTLATLAQYVQSQTGVAPGWPLDTATTVAGALFPRRRPGPTVAAIVRQMSKSIVEVEVARGASGTVETWDGATIFDDDQQVLLPVDAVVATVTVGMAAAAAAVRGDHPSSPDLH